MFEGKSQRKSGFLCISASKIFKIWQAKWMFPRTGLKSEYFMFPPESLIILREINGLRILPMLPNGFQWIPMDPSQTHTADARPPPRPRPPPPNLLPPSLLSSQNGHLVYAHTWYTYIYIYIHEPVFLYSCDERKQCTRNPLKTLGKQAGHHHKQT